jgi:pyruvate dehydrogenase E2 component (dihydrolipoamide acetyltransferase)
MKRWEFKLPDIGEGVTEGEIVAWADGIAEGVVVQADQALAEVMTDKATVTITSPKTGTIVQLGGAVGQVIAVGAALVVLDLDAGAASAAPVADDAPAAPAPAPAAAAAEPKKESGNAATAVGDIKEDLPGMNLSPAPAAKKTVESAGSSYFAAKPLATPATRKLARELGLDLRTVPPSGPHGRVTKEDVRARSQGSGASPTATPATISAPPSTESRTPEASATRFAPMKIAAATTEETALETREPLRGVRKKIFDSMSRSKQTAAHFTFVEECDVTALKDLRARLRPAAEKEGVKLTFLPFIVKATVAALKRHPELNSAFDESTQEIVRRAYINIGIASSTENGLIVPVVKGADRRSILDIAREIQRLGEATKSGKVKAADLQGSTFTITSLGQQGGLFATPILNFPEVGILGVHQIKQKPVVRNNQIVIGDVMLLSLSFDHRLIDGHVGAAFAYEIIRFLENPDALFLEMA